MTTNGTIERYMPRCSHNFVRVTRHENTIEVKCQACAVARKHDAWKLPDVMLNWLIREAGIS